MTASLDRTSIAVAERFCRTVDRINPARVCGSYRRPGRGAFALDLASLCPLLQQHQNAPVTGQRCAGLSSHSTDREHHVTSDPRWASSPLRSDLGFRYTQGWKAETLAHATAIFRQVNKNEQWLHHDALEFPGGRIVLLTKLLAGQEATVLQLPAQPTTAAEADAQMRLAYVG